MHDSRHSRHTRGGYGTARLLPASHCQCPDRGLCGRFPRICTSLTLGLILSTSCKDGSFHHQVCSEPCVPAVQLAAREVAAAHERQCALPGPGPTLASALGSGTTAVQQMFFEQLGMSDGMTPGELLANHSAEYLEEPGFSPRDASYHGAFVEAFDLDAQEIAKLDHDGFVLLPASIENGHGYLYGIVYANDLPVFISADSILHAWHRTFDRILEDVELHILLGELTLVLEAMTAGIDPVEQDGIDALFYLTVALQLIEPDHLAHPAVAGEVATYMERIASRRNVTLPFMGVPTEFDFGQMEPRGHYTHSVELASYFQAMMWLGKTDLVLYSADPADPARPREEAAARALARILAATGQDGRLEAISDTVDVLVGSDGTLDPEGLLRLCEEAGMEMCVGDPGTMLPSYRATPIAPYTGRAGDETPALVMRLLSQRFAYDSWALSRVTYPRFGTDPERTMPGVEDVAFILGSDRALLYMRDDFVTPGWEDLPGVLESVRATMGSLPPSSIDGSIYNHWLEALMAMSAPTTGDSYPRVMRTAAWHDRKMESVLASWAEIRHDTILYTEQSTSDVVVCQYPDGYIEPVPCLFASLRSAAARLRDLDLGGLEAFAGIDPFLEHWIDVMTRLELMAAKEIAGVRWSCEDMDFINDMVQMDSVCGGRTFDGWYPDLYWEGIPSMTVLPGSGTHPCASFEPVVADVHTDLFQQEVLQVATGSPGLLIVAIDSRGELALYAGPVSSFWWFHQPAADRMTDERWSARVESGDLPPRPAFASSYWAPWRQR